MKRLKQAALVTAGAALMFALTPPAFAAVIPIDDTNFPDANFRPWVNAFDKNHDGKLTEAEGESEANLIVPWQSIKNLKGIEYLTGIELLNCNNNELTDLDVSKNSKLVIFRCANNKLTAVDVSHNDKLETLDLKGNEDITSLDVSKNPALKALEVTGTKLQTLDLTNNPQLVSLRVNENQLTNLNLKLNPYITDANLTAQVREVEADQNTRQLDLTTLPGFDVSKASNWTNAAVTGNILTVSDGKDEVTYDYDTSFPGSYAAAKTLKVTLKVKFVDKGGPATIPTERIAGANRVATSLAGFAQVTNKSTVVLATGTNFPDGLTGGALAGALKGAVVLTAAGNLEPEVLAALKNAHTTKVYIVGGVGAVSAAKENALKAAGMTTVRLDGSDRYATAKAVVAETKKVLGTTNVAFLATGANFPDALAASAAAARMGGVVNLVAPGVAATADADAAKTYCVGGPACAKPGAGVDTVICSNRMETAFELSQLTPPTTNAMVAYSQNFPDALSAGGLAASLDANLFLSNGMTATVPTGTAKVYLIGGTGVLPDSLTYTTK